jgi:hypothetical protein
MAPKNFLQEAVEDAVNWLRNNDPKLDGVTSTTAQAFSNITGLPLPKKKMSPDESKKFVEDAVNWLRRKDPELGNVDKPTADEVTKVASALLPALSQPKDRKYKAMEEQ